jgi:signal peptidase II
MAALRERLPDLLLAASVAALDQWTKSRVRQAIPLHHERPLIDGLLSLRHGRNPGLAFGLLSRADLPHQSLWLAVAGLACLALLLLYMLRVPARPRLPRVALALILGGAAGNLLDRSSLGYVTDFVHVFHGTWQFHDFNLADAAISVGVALLLLSGLLPRDGARAQPR